MAKNKVEVGAAFQLIQRDITKLARSLQEYLTSCGVTPADNKLSTLIEALHETKTIKQGVDYLHLRVNADGYITELEEFGDVIIKEKLPADITRGYYKPVNGKPILDELMRRKLWEV